MTTDRYRVILILNVFSLLLLSLNPSQQLRAAPADPTPTITQQDNTEGDSPDTGSSPSGRITLSDGALIETGITGATEINAEVGSDFRLSSMGPADNASYDALNPAVAYGSSNQQYLVVWSGSDAVIGEYEIWGQRVNALTGAQIGDDFKISSTGPANDPDFDAVNPDVVYNPITNEYLVVWSADNYVDGEYEIYGRRVYVNGALSTQFRISVMGPEGNVGYDANTPAVTYNSHDNEFLVVWSGSTGDLFVGENEIWAKRITANGEWGGNQLRMSDMGGTGNANYDALNPAVAYDSNDNQYLIVWEGDDTSGTLANNEFEIWGQRVNAALGGLGSNDFRISDMGNDGNAALDAQNPAVTYNPMQYQFLVVWEGDNSTDNVFDIYGQRLTSTGAGIGSNDFNISYLSIGPSSQYDAFNPAVAYDILNDEYFVVYQDDAIRVDEYEIWGQRINGVDPFIGFDTRLSDMGAEGDALFDAQTPAVIYSDSHVNQYLVLWSGDNSTDGEFEIWAQLFTGAFKVFLPVILK